MIVNWSLIIVLFCLSIPGVYLVMTRLIFFLLPNNTPTLKKRFSRFAVGQTLLMVLVMSFAGTVLSVRIGLHASLLAGILPGESEFNSFIAILLPIFLYTLLGLVIFIALYYGMVSSILDEHSMRVLNNLRLALGVDGSALYGVAEEIIARWGLMNFFVFFAITVTGAATPVTIFVALMVSAILFAIGQIPAYIAAGCISSRRFMYCLILLSLCQSLLFGFLFWQYGLIAAFIAHILFHIGWAQYDKL